MMSTTKTRLPLGPMFIAALALSWTPMTVAITMVMWTERSEPPVRLATWLSLWTFSVLMPTLNAFTIHRVVSRLSEDGAHEGPLHELARLRPFLLLSANMALLSAFALILGR